MILLKKKKYNDNERKVFPIVADMLNVWEEMSEENNPADVLGSYTGTTADDNRPEQDADDL